MITILLNKLNTQHAMAYGIMLIICSAFGAYSFSLIKQHLPQSPMHTPETLAEDFLIEIAENIHYPSNDPNISAKSSDRQDNTQQRAHPSNALSFAIQNHNSQKKATQSHIQLASYQPNSGEKASSISTHISSRDMITMLPNSIQPTKKTPPKMYFPLAHPPILPFTRDARQFGALRDWGQRLHAGVDLVEYAGEPVFAITHGKIIAYEYFTNGTYAISVDHDRFVIRYGEVRSMWGNLKIGSIVKPGQKIGIVGLHYGTKNQSMLHLEKYTGKVTGPLTQSVPPYQRRRDLVNPTRFIQSLKGHYPE